MNRILRQLFGRKPERLQGAEAAAPATDHRRHEEEDASVLEAARQRLAERDVVGARALLEPRAATNNHVPTLLMLGRVCMMLGDFGRSHEYLLRVEAVDPANVTLWESMAELHAVQEDFAQELVYRRKLIYLVREAPARAYVAWIRAFMHVAQKSHPGSLQEVVTMSERVTHAKGLTQALQLEFAEWLFAAKKLGDKARAHYTAANPCPIHQRDVTAEWVSLQGWCERSGAKLHRMEPNVLGSREILLAELRDVCIAPHFQWIPILGDGEVALEGFVMSRMRTRSEYEHTPLLMQNLRYTELRLPREMPRFQEPALLIGGMPQYYHNTIEYLSRLSIVDSFGIGKERRLVVNDDLAPFQLEQLQLLGYGPERLIRVRADQPVRFSDLLVPSILVRGGTWMDPIIPAWYRRKFVRTDAAHATRRIYLSRAGAPRRRVSNEAVLAQMLVSCGYEIVRPETLTVREQIDLLSQASHLVGATGAALTNMIYMPPNSSVIGLYNRYVSEGGGGNYFDALSQSCGHRFSLVEGFASQFESKRLVDADFEIDVQALEAVLLRN